MTDIRTQKQHQRDYSNELCRLTCMAELLIAI